MKININLFILFTTKLNNKFYIIKKFENYLLYIYYFKKLNVRM